MYKHNMQLACEKRVKWNINERGVASTNRVLVQKKRKIGENKRYT